MDDGLFILLAVTCDQQRSAVGPVIYIVLRPTNGWSHPMLSPITPVTLQQLQIRADLKYLLLLSVRYSVIADSRRSAEYLLLANAINYIITVYRSLA